MKGSVFFLSLVLLFNFHNFAEALCIKRTTTLCPECNRVKTDIVSLGTTTLMDLPTPAPPTVPPTPPPTTMPTTTKCETTSRN